MVIWDAKLDNFINKQDRFDTFFKDYTKTSYEIGSFKFIVLVKKKERKKERITEKNYLTVSKFLTDLIIIFAA